MNVSGLTDGIHSDPNSVFDWAIHMALYGFSYYESITNSDKTKEDEDNLISSQKVDVYIVTKVSELNGDNSNGHKWDDVTAKCFKSGKISNEPHTHKLYHRGDTAHYNIEQIYNSGKKDTIFGN
jgi:hypothetical protein